MTLDEDVAAKLKREARRSGRAFREVVNETLRRGLLADAAGTQRSPFKVHARDMGALGPGLSIDNIGDLLERVEGPLHR